METYNIDEIPDHLKSYFEPAEWGSEPTIQAYLDRMVELFAAIREALRDDGTVWLNLGDGYAGSGVSNHKNTGGALPHQGGEQITPITDGLKPKDLIGMPWRVALALQADGWYLRSDIIWHKCLSGGTRVYAQTQKGVMPMSIKDLVRLDPTTIKLWNGDIWTQVVSWSETSRPDRPLEIELRSGEKIGCTPNHLWPTQRGNIRADELRVGDVIKTCELPAINNESPKYVPDDMGWFVGLFIAEGSYGKDGSVLQFASHESEIARFDRLRTIASAYDGTCQMHKVNGGHAATINIYCPALAGILKQYVYGTTAKNKGLTSKAWGRSNDFLHAVMMGYLSGDGHHDKYNNRWRLGFTRNDRLAADLRTIAARLGWQLRLKLSVAKNEYGEFKAYRGEVRESPSTHHNARPNGEVVSIANSRGRKFWDIAVEDNPHLFALASGVLTHNSNPMPESVTDRPTKAHEYIFLLSKSAQYYYDADAIREPHADTIHTQSRYQYKKSLDRKSARNIDTNWGDDDLSSYFLKEDGYRNARTVWTVPTQPFPGAHFAVFPEALIKPCVLAGAPEKSCAECGAPYVREVIKTKTGQTLGKPKDNGGALRNDGQQWAGRIGDVISETLGFSPSCNCNAGTRPGLVYDPFMGAGTTAVVAKSHGRNFIGSELNPEYIQLANARLDGSIKRLVADKNQKDLSGLPLFELLDSED